MQLIATKDEHKLIHAIETSPQVKKLLRELDYHQLDFEMDLVACHSNGCPLDFNALLFFSDFDRMHDITGIRHNIDRTTGKLENCFVPRCARKEAAT